MTPRRAVRAAVVGGCLLAGAVTTVGAAWGAMAMPHSLRVPSGDLRRFVVSDGEYEWQVIPFPERHPRKVYIQVGLNVPEASTPPRVADLPSSHRPPSWAEPPLAPDGPDIVETMTTNASGWPFAALRAWGRATLNRVTRVWTPHPGRGSLIVGTQWLPCEPIARGFFLDTLFYAAAWWALLAAPGFARGWLRRRRNRCVACGYDLRGLADGAACPECGQAKQRAARREPAPSHDC